MRSCLSFVSGPASSYSNEVEPHTTLSLLIRSLMGVWRLRVLRVPNRGRTLSISLHLSCTDNIHTFLLLYSPIVVVRWKNTLFLGVDACFKLKLKDRGIDDPDLGTGQAYMVNERAYQTHLVKTADITEQVSFYCSFI